MAVQARLSIEEFMLRRSQPESPVFDVSVPLTSGDVLSTPLLDGLSLAIDDLLGS